MSRDPRKTAIQVSLFISVLMLAGKWAAFVLTGSAAIFSDAAESVVHIAATGVAAFSLWYSLRPADDTHPYGHGRIAYFSAGLEGALILIAALAILYTAVHALIVGPQLQSLNVGLWVTAVLALVNLLLGWYLIRTGRRHNSLVLVANGTHVLTDSWTSWGVVAGVALVVTTDLLWLDPIVAIVVGGHILWSAISMIRGAYLGLMDTAQGADTQRLLEVLRRCVSEKRIADFHQLRHRTIDHNLWIEVHLLLAGGMTLSEAHERVNQVEEAVRAAFPDRSVHITSHSEPEEHDLAHPGGHATRDPIGA